MANDVEIITGGQSAGSDVLTGAPPKLAVRLCNFPTAKASPLPAHLGWLEAYAKPLILSLTNPTVRIDGFASRAGDGTANQHLSEERGEALKKWIARYSATINFELDSRGAVQSGPDRRDNDGHNRAVEIVYLGGHMEFAATTGRDRSCPGNLLMAQMNDLRKALSLVAPKR
jgi:hypothetical protein